MQYKFSIIGMSAIGHKGIKSDSFEIKTRKTNKIINLSLNEIFNFINENMV